MNSIDITRNGYAPAKRYSGVLHTQGSVLLDADQNDAELIDQNNERRTVTDLLVTAGSPDNGFRLATTAVPLAPYDFRLRAGTYYLGGVRYEIPVAEHFRRQSEWLQMRETGGAALPNDWLPATISAVPAAVPTAARTDLVWFEGWEQAVSGCEDQELVETAFAVESSARLRPMRKVHLFPNAGNVGCSAGFAGLVAALEATSRFTYDDDTHELRSNRRMQVGFVDVGAAPDPCTPSQRRGFLGAENETIQVRVISDTRFVWSFSNAAPMYRVTLAGQTLHFVSPPRDALLRPLAGDVIELVRCDAILPNGELIGERNGLFFRVLSSFDPATGNVGLDADPLLVPGPFPNNTANAAVLHTALGLPGAPDGHFYARVWRGEAIAAAQVGKPFVAATPVQLGNTGLTATFSGNGPVGDSWTFSVRPNTPELIMPWSFMQPSPPTGTRRFIAGLGLIRWDAAGTIIEATDCRRRVRKLENASSCCEVTVGDNQESFGDVSTIADALDRLPASGGKICLLRGSFTETVHITGRQDIVIEGCGNLTRLRGQIGNLAPVIGLTDCERIKLRGFAIEAQDRIAVAIDDTGTMDFGEHTRDIKLEVLLIASRDAPAAIFNGGDGLSVDDCHVTLATIPPPTAAGGINGMVAALLLFGARMRVEKSSIVGQSNVDRAELPIGGIHVIGGSELVEIRRNRIERSAGHGIALGSVTMVPQGTAPSNLPLRTRLPMATAMTWPQFAATGQDPTLMAIGFIVIYLISADGCTTIVTTIPTSDGSDGRTYVPDADPFIMGCRIIDNDILAMGECGIAPFAQFDLSQDKQLCGVAGLEIRRNRIRNCTRNEAGAVVGGAMVFTARGGVVLGWAEDLDFVDNLIEGCGNARNTPICGFFAAGLAKARFSRNRIHDNGLRLTDMTAVAPLGQRGGIVIRSVMPGTVSLASVLPIHGAAAIRIQNGREALVVQGNEVSSPEGRALHVTGTGAMSITANQFASLGSVAASAFWQAIVTMMFGSGSGAAIPALSAMLPMIKYDPVATLMGNAVVSVTNIGLSADTLALMPFGFGVGFDAASGGNVKKQWLLTTGRVMFNSNQTRFDGLGLPIAVVPVLVGLLSLDDAAMGENQCDADFWPGGADWPMVHGCIVSVTQRMANNRFSEPDIGLGGVGLLHQLSGLCIGMGNMVHHNFGTHCFLSISPTPALTVIDPNISLVGPDECKRMIDATSGRLGAMLGGTGMVAVGRVDEEDYSVVKEGWE